MALKCISQSDIRDTSSIGIPAYRLSLAAQDLERKDECDSLLSITNAINEAQSKTIIFKDSVISNLNQEKIILNNSVESYKIMDQFKDEYINSIKSENKTLRIKNILLGVGMLITSFFAIKN